MNPALLHTKINTFHHTLPDNIEQFVKGILAYRNFKFFKPCLIKHHFYQWAQLTPISNILKITSGYKLQFEKVRHSLFTGL